jgi:hypothetical protein
VGSGVSEVSTSGIGVRAFSFEPPSPVACFDTAFLFSDELCDTTFDFVENLESREVFPVDSHGRGMEDFPLLMLESPAEADGDPTGEISMTLSIEMMLGRLLNCVRWITVGSSCPFDNARDNFRRRPEGSAGEEQSSGSAKEAFDTIHSISLRSHVSSFRTLAAICPRAQD